jgi:hypothetical protein
MLGRAEMKIYCFQDSGWLKIKVHPSPRSETNTFSSFPFLISPYVYRFKIGMIAKSARKMPVTALKVYGTDISALKIVPLLPEYLMYVR